MMHDDTAEGRAVAARTEQPRRVFRIDWREVAAYAGMLAVMAVCVAAYFLA